MNNELYHYGIPGMKWGVKRAVKKYSNKSQRQANVNTRNAKTLKKILDSNYDHTTGLKLDKKTKKAYMHEYKESIETAKKWIKTRDDIMNMKISSVNVKDIKKRFNDSRSSGVYYPFA